MYLPKSKYKEAKYSRGEEFYLPNKKSYIGWYFETYKKEFFTGKTPGTGNLLLTRKDAESVNKDTLNFIPETIQPDSTDMEKGKFKRFYVKDTRNKRIIEVGKEKYYKFTAKSYIQGVELDWITKGPKDDLMKDQYKYQGAESKNKQTVQTYNNMMEGLKEYIKDYGEFVE